MRIDSHNANIINTNEIYIHDYVFKGITFDYIKKNISVYGLNSSITPCHFSISFFNVISFKMTSYEPWGKSPHILDWEYIDDSNNTLLESLIVEQDSKNCSISMLSNKKAYIESVITLVSGDKFIVICEYIEFEECTGDECTGDGSLCSTIPTTKT